MKPHKTQKDYINDLNAIVKSRSRINWLWIDERLKVVCIAGLIVGGTIYFGIIAPMNQQEKDFDCKIGTRIYTCDR